MGCEESFITIKLIWHGYLVPSLGICVHETPTETGLIIIVLCDLKMIIILLDHIEVFRTILLFVRGNTITSHYFFPKNIIDWSRRPGRALCTIRIAGPLRRPDRMKPFLRETIATKIFFCFYYQEQIKSY